MSGALAAIAAFMAAQLALGVWISRRIRTEDDFLVAGRRLGWWLTTFSVFATWFGAETVVGAAGLAYQEGVSLASAEPFGYGLCLVLMGAVFAVPLWRRRLTTLADLYRQRYSVAVERLAAVVLIPGSVLWAAAQVRAFGQVLSGASELEVELAILFAGGFTIAYTMLGGLLADAITDLVQGAILALGLLALGVGTVVALGGPAEAASLAAGSKLAWVPQARPAIETLEAWAIPVCGSVVATELVGRIVGARSARVAAGSSLAAGAIYLGLGTIPLFVGLVGSALLPSLDHPEQIMPSLARELLPTFGYVLFSGALLCAILSTVDSTLLVASGLLEHNLISPLWPRVGERGRVALARAGVAGFGVLALALALRAGGVFELVEQASAIGSAGSLVTVAFGLFTPLGGPRTAAATLCAGVLVYLGASVGGLAWPFLASLGAALATYLLGVQVERLAASRRAYQTSSSGRNSATRSS